MTESPHKSAEQHDRYRITVLIAALAALALAFWSKYYTGPYENFSDAYLGDVFIVMCLYFFLAFARPQLSIASRLFFIAALATFVELLQLSGWPAQLNLPEPFVFILGTSFDPKDFVFYAIGLLSALVLDTTVCQRFRKTR